MARSDSAGSLGIIIIIMKSHDFGPQLHLTFRPSCSEPESIVIEMAIVNSIVISSKRITMISSVCRVVGADDCWQLAPATKFVAHRIGASVRGSGRRLQLMNWIASSRANEATDLALAHEERNFQFHISNFISRILSCEPRASSSGAVSLLLADSRSRYVMILSSDSRRRVEMN